MTKMLMILLDAKVYTVVDVVVWLSLLCAVAVLAAT